MMTKPKKAPCIYLHTGGVICTHERSPAKYCNETAARIDGCGYLETKEKDKPQMPNETIESAKKKVVDEFKQAGVGIGKSTAAFGNYGWICPVCGRGNSPFNQTCGCKPFEYKVTC